MARKNGNSCPVPKGILLIIGGAEEKTLEKVEEKEDEKMKEEEHEDQAVLKFFVSLMARKESPLVEVITTSSGDPETTFNDNKKVINQKKSYLKISS